MPVPDVPTNTNTDGLQRVKADWEHLQSFGGELGALEWEAVGDCALGGTKEGKGLKKFGEGLARPAVITVPIPAVPSNTESDELERGKADWEEPTVIV
jgi:hypothetical protein